MAERRNILSFGPSALLGVLLTCFLTSCGTRNREAKYLPPAKWEWCVDVIYVRGIQDSCSIYALPPINPFILVEEEHLPRVAGLARTTTESKLKDGLLPSSDFTLLLNAILEEELKRQDVAPEVHWRATRRRQAESHMTVEEWTGKHNWEKLRRSATLDHYLAVYQMLLERDEDVEHPVPELYHALRDAYDALPAGSS